MTLILVSRPRSRVMLIRLNRPEKRNALSVQMMSELAAVLNDAARDDDIGCVVVTGDARAFSAGADIADQHARGTDSTFAPERLAAWSTVERFPKPLIAAVDGYALGGGNELAMLADVIIAGDHAIFGQPEIKIGITPGDGATQRLPRLVGKSMAMKMILSGEMIDAPTALQFGLVAEVVPAAQTVERALDLAATIAEKSPIALRLVKEAVLKAFELPLAEGLAFERETVGRAMASEDRREGMAAFLEKRPPRFKGR